MKIVYTYTSSGIHYFFLMTSSDDDFSSDIDFASVKSMNQYEANVIEEKAANPPPTSIQSKDETPEQILKNIQRIRNQLAEAKLNGKDRLIEKLEAKLQDEESKYALSKLLPSEIDVDISLADQNADSQNSEQLPEQNDALLRFWHYKVLHTSFAGENSINLTLDDSDEEVFLARNSFIKNHCEPYSELTTISENLKIPTSIWNSLFPHQRVAVEWLWEKWNDKHGGIEGDEMGLGKTAIACTFIHTLAVSGILKKPTLILCPLTVAQQWIREFHIWCPQLKSILLHSTRSNKKVSDEDILRDAEDTTSVIVTNYETLHRMRKVFPIHTIDWGIVICDEGHKIRNYLSTISRLVKKIGADFRLAITGSPIQNSLIELWSLFDFAIPGLLGSIDVFETEFAEPIKIGGYANANSFQVFRAYSSAVALRDLIKPYLLRRMKKDVNADLPDKLEQIFFIQLTPLQVQAYHDFTKSNLCKAILNGRCEMFAGIDYLRKLCDHPFMADPEKFTENLETSAKLNLLKKLLPQWKKKNHRVLLFSQYLKMLDLIQIVFDELDLDYFRIDGETPNEKRIALIDRFNCGEKFGFISSTKVGGVGVNLVGADRVVIVDPDWNPSTDSQALERAWRIGQKKDVVVYRLITVGTIEEKMYKKQIFKQFLSNKILQNPNQKRMFAPETIQDLFKLDYGLQPDFIEHDNGNDANPQVERVENVATDENVDDDEYDADNVDQGNDKELLKNLFDDGNLVGVFHHDHLFDKSAESADTLINRKKAERSVNEAKNKLKLSSDRIQSQKNSDQDPVLASRIVREILDLFHRNKNIMSSQSIVDHFRVNPELNHKRHIKNTLKKVAHLNKRAHMWHLLSKYKEA